MDLRIQKTYRALNNAFTDLLSKNRYEGISVAALCDAAMIRRTTFYKHFRDKDDFFAFYIDNFRAEVLNFGETIPARSEAPSDPEEFKRECVLILNRLTDTLIANEPLVENILRSSMIGTMMNVICDGVADTLRERHRIDPTDTLSFANAAVEFTAGGVVRLLMSWWMMGEAASHADEFAENAWRLIATVMGEGPWIK
ncbi:TetR/AcrR family transcriptional regulator [Collinsella sp. AGMB00827]|uniref:TetR/AcrR family transcriptional regulator n=1 Tax=Collinsella ureilytica TaxID=2869515 RepID=A0ABS7MLA5_9ACTN|nr:TetR/AcrR family transcriptional regulator [Collinsella urealyticum]MBY4797856.1 TetR/AcrR family transcriptional regulator [Collinsella urealyticum]